MLHIKDHIFFLMQDKKIFLWDSLNHKQFEIETDYLNELIYINKNGTSSNKKIATDLMNEDIISNEKKPISWGWDKLSYLFHKGTRNIGLSPNSVSTDEQWSNHYLEYCEKLEKIPDILTTYSNHKDIFDLSEPNLSLFKNKSLLEVMYARKTCRQFFEYTIPEEIISTILYLGFGPVHGKIWDEFESLGLNITEIRKLSASGGGIHPIEAYVYINNVQGIDPGIYVYDQGNHKLILKEKNINADQIVQLLYGQYFARNLSAGIFLTVRMDKSWWKYKHSRAYRNILVDIGHYSQNIQLLMTGLDLQTWITGAFHDDAVDQILGIENPEIENAFFFIGCGHSKPFSIDTTTVKILNE